MRRDTKREVCTERADDLTDGADESMLDPRRIYADMAHALARGYTDLYYVNISTDQFIEFHTDDESGVLSKARVGSDFFEGCERDAKKYIHPEDRDTFVEAMNPEFLRNALEGNGHFEFSYRRIKGEVPIYVNMTVSQMEDDQNLVVLAVADIDELTKQRQAEERIEEERIVYARLHALTGNFIAVYVVNPETNAYHEFSATDQYVEHFAQAKEGDDFFAAVRDAAKTFNHPDDLDRFLSAFTKEGILSSIGNNGIFTLDYRLLMDGSPIFVHC